MHKVKDLFHFYFIFSLGLRLGYDGVNGLQL